jgi:hypothetical protein
MDVTRLVWLMAVEIEAIRSGPQHGWHGPILPNCESIRTGIHYGGNSDPYRLREKQPTATGARFREFGGTAGLGGNVRASRAWKGAYTPKMCSFSVRARFPALGRAILF